MQKSKPSLFSTIQKTTTISSQVNGEIIRKIPIDKLIDNPLNKFSMEEDEDFNRSLKSIETDGMWEDIIVTPDKDDCYRIISGHRRKKIAQKLNLKTLPCKVRTYQTELEEARALIGENIHKRTITPLDMAYQLETLSQVLDRAGMPNSVQERTEQLIEQTGLSRATILRYLDLLRLNQTVTAWIKSGAMPMTDAYFLAQKNNSVFQDKLIDEVNRLDTQIPLEKRIQTALDFVKQIKKEKKAVNKEKKYSSLKTVRKCRMSVSSIYNQINELFTSEDFKENRNSMQNDINELQNELEALLNAFNKLKENLND